MRFESAQFKLSHEMTQLLDPSGSMKSETWHKFVRQVPLPLFFYGFTENCILNCILNSLSLSLNTVYADYICNSLSSLHGST